MGCHFLLQCRKVKSESEVAQSCPTLHDPMDCSLLGSSVHGIFQASTGMGCHCLLQGIRVMSALFHDEATSIQSLPFRKHLINIWWMRSPRKVKTKATWTSSYKLLIEQYPKRFITIRTMLRPSIVGVFCYIQCDFFLEIMSCIMLDPEDAKWIIHGSSEASP